MPFFLPWFFTHNHVPHLYNAFIHFGWSTTCGLAIMKTNRWIPTFAFTHWNEVRILSSYCLNLITIHPTQHDICSNVYFALSSTSQIMVWAFQHLFSNNMFWMCWFESKVKFYLHKQTNNTQPTRGCNFIYDTSGFKDFMVLCCISNGLPFETFHVLCKLLV